MSVRLQVFSEVALLSVARPVGGKQVRVLVAGIGRVFESGAKVIVVDALRATVNEEAVILLHSVKKDFPVGQPDGRRVLIVSSIPEIADFASLADAFQSAGVTEGAALIELSEISHELALLEEAKVALEKVLGGGIAEATVAFRKARGEKARIDGLKKGLTVMLSRLKRRVDAWLKKKRSAA